MLKFASFALRLALELLGLAVLAALAFAAVIAIGGQIFQHERMIAHCGRSETIKVEFAGKKYVIPRTGDIHISGVAKAHLISETYNVCYREGDPAIGVSMIAFPGLLDHPRYRPRGCEDAAPADR